MKVVSQEPSAGRIWSISVQSSIGRRQITSLLGSLDGVSIVKKPSIFSFLRDQPFCFFDFKGQRFSIEAEWPSFNTFEISPVPRGCKDQIIEIKNFLEKQKD
jgi:hypothetical protein